MELSAFDSLSELSHFADQALFSPSSAQLTSPSLILPPEDWAPLDEQPSIVSYPLEDEDEPETMEEQEMIEEEQEEEESEGEEQHEDTQTQIARLEEENALLKRRIAEMEYVCSLPFRISEVHLLRQLFSAYAVGNKIFEENPDKLPPAYHFCVSSSMLSLHCPKFMEKRREFAGDFVLFSLRLLVQALRELSPSARGELKAYRAALLDRDLFSSEFIEERLNPSGFLFQRPRDGLKTIAYHNFWVRRDVLEQVLAVVTSRFPEELTKPRSKPCRSNVTALRQGHYYRQMSVHFAFAPVGQPGPGFLLDMDADEFIATLVQKIPATTLAHDSVETPQNKPTKRPRRRTPKRVASDGDEDYVEV